MKNRLCIDTRVIYKFILLFLYKKKKVKFFLFYSPRYLYNT